MIRFLAGLIKEALDQWDDTGGFVGHVGGDDFVAICRGYYVSRDRKGRVDNYPLLSLSIAGLTTENRSFHSYGHLVAVASEIKKKIKAINGSQYHIDQRHE